MANTDIESGKEEVDAKIPVGVSRLHLVELPNLKVPSTPDFAARYLYSVDETNILESSARYFERSSRNMVLQKHYATSRN
jgi:hypothetical protein